MSIQYLKTKTNASFVRPVGYRYPAGLNVGTINVEYLVVAGGGGGGGSGADGAGGYAIHSFTGSGTFTANVAHYFVN